MRYSIVFICILLSTLAAEAQYHSLYGTIRANRNLNPVPGVHVWVEGGLDTVVSNSSGAYSLSLLNGTYTVHFERPAYCPYARPLLIVGSDVALSVEVDDPLFYCNVTSITVVTWPGHDVQETFFISNATGLCPLQYSITDTSAWLSASPASGLIADDSMQTITVFVDGDAVPPGHDVQSVVRIEHSGTGGLYLIPVMFAVSLEAGEPAGLSPTSISLFAYPNPFNPAGTLSLTLASTEPTELRVYDLSGRCVATLIKETLAAGEHRVTFDGSGVPSGVYFARLKAGAVQTTQKIVLLK